MLGSTDMVIPLMFITDYLTKPVDMLNLIYAIKRVFPSFELIIVNIVIVNIVMVNIVINAVNQKYPDRNLWNDLEIHKSGFILYNFLKSKSVFSCTEDKGYPGTCT